MHFRHISAKIKPKNLKYFHHKLLAVRGNISIGDFILFVNNLYLILIVNRLTVTYRTFCRILKANLS